jgi:lysophospholipase L1-like esterase
MQIERGTLNTLLVNARPTLTPSRWLLWFRDPERNASVYCLCSAIVAGSPTLIRFEETDTPTALNGQVKLSPPGNWTLKIYEQSSTTNLNPANATRLVEERAVFVVGAVEPESGWSGTECPPGSGDDCEEGTVVLVDSEGTELDSVTVASAGDAFITAPDVTVRQTDGNTGITIGSAPAGGTYLLPETVIRYNDGSGVVTTQTYNTLGSSPNITPDVTVPARALKDSNDNPIGSTVITLADLLDNTIPNCPACDEVTLCGLITEGTSEEVAICVISSGKRPGVLAEIIPTVPEGDTVAQVYDVMTPAQQDLFDVTVQLQDSAASPIGAPDVYAAGTTTTKTAPDGTVTVVDHLGDTIGSTTVKSNGTAQVLVTDWEGEYPVLNENVPTYDDEGTSTTGWTLTAGSLTQPSASVVRFTQTTAGVAATAARAITMPVTNKDWVLYTKARAANGTGGKVIQIVGPGLERTNIGFHINYVTGSSAPGVLSIRHTTAAGTNTNAVAATAINATNYIDLALAFNSKFASLSLFSRQTNGTWKFECQIGATFHGGNLQIVVNQSGTPAWLDFDWITLVSPNIQSIGDSLTKGATLFSPTIADALNNGDSTWQRWAALYPAIRNNLTINKGVGGNTIGMVEARIQADVLDNIPALVLLGACSNDYGAGTSQADKTTNTQDCINLCATAGVPVVLFNGTYCTAAWASNPAGGAYYKEWWDDYMPTLTGLEGTIDIMGGLKDPAGYADTVLTQSDNVHPNVVGYGRMGQWIAALPYA